MERFAARGLCNNWFVLNLGRKIQHVDHLDIGNVVRHLILCRIPKNCRRASRKMPVTLKQLEQRYKLACDNKRLRKVYCWELCYNHSQGFSTALPKHKWIIPWRARSFYRESWRNGTASKGGDQKWKDLLLKRLTKYKKKMKNWPQRVRFDNKRLSFGMQKTPLTTILFFN